MSAYIVEADTLYRVINLITKINYVNNSLKPIKDEAILTPQILFNKLNTLNRFAISERYEAEKMTDKPSYKFNLEIMLFKLYQVLNNTNNQHGVNYMNNFKNWIDTFIEEKNLPMEDTFTIDKNGTMNIMSYKTIYEHILIANDDEQKQIKNMIVQIDYMNGNILNFFQHLGKLISKEVAWYLIYYCTLEFSL